MKPIMDSFEEEMKYHSGNLEDLILKVLEKTDIEFEGDIEAENTEQIVSGWTIDISFERDWIDYSATKNLSFHAQNIEKETQNVVKVLNVYLAMKEDKKYFKQKEGVLYLCEK